MSNDNFSWQDDEMVIIKRTDAIAVYGNSDGDVVYGKKEWALAIILTIRL